MEEKKYTACSLCGATDPSQRGVLCIGCSHFPKNDEKANSTTIIGHGKPDTYHGDKPIEEIWESFWKPIVSNPDGTVNIEQVKKELADFSFVMEQVPKVYCHITGDMMSKVMYKAEDVIRMADDHFSEALREAVKEEVEKPGAVWVKASTKLPTPGRITWRWLDKAEAYSGYDEKRGFIYGTGGASVDPTYYTEIEWLDEAAPSGEREVAFAEWIREQNYKPYAGWWYLNGNNYANQPCSTAQLYELFKQQHL